MSSLTVTRRQALLSAGGAVAATALVSPAEAALSEIEEVRQLVGQRFTVRHGAQSVGVVLERVEAIGRPARPPLSAPGRTPFVVIFKPDAEAEIEPGTLEFTQPNGAMFHVLVSGMPHADGTQRLEAVFN